MISASATLPSILLQCESCESCERISDNERSRWCRKVYIEFVRVMLGYLKCLLEIIVRTHIYCYGDNGSESFQDDYVMCSGH